ncbi:hypothetical protein Hanom_Chr17g01576621 [Helianthus anomalus]
MVVQCSLSTVILVALSLCTNVELLTYCDMVRFVFFRFRFFVAFCCVLIVFSVSFLSDSIFSVFCFVFVSVSDFLFGFGCFFGSVSIFSSFLFCFVLDSSVRFRFFFFVSF